MEIKCTKCGNTDIGVQLKRKFSNIPRELYSYLSPEIKAFMNNNSRGDTVEVYEEFLLCKCSRCCGDFFVVPLDSKLNKGEK